MSTAIAARSWFRSWTITGVGMLAFVALVGLSGARGQEAAPAEPAPSPGAPEVTDDLALEQERLTGKYARLEELLLKRSSL